MKKIKYLLLVFCFSVLSCNKLDVPPMNIIKDQDVFNSVNGITAYMAKLYSSLPVEDFKYSANLGFNNWNFIANINMYSGEGVNKNISSLTNGNNGYWGAAFTLIRQADYFIETLPKYSANFSNNQTQINQWLGEAHFIRAYTYFALAKRYGGVPIIDKVQYYPEESVQQLQVPRNSEEEVYDYIGQDLDFAIQNMGGTSVQKGRANKYAAAALKSRAMLFAGSIAKYNSVQLFDQSGKRLQGIPSSKADTYFKASYDASMILQGHYSLYRAGLPDKYQNYVNLFSDDNSSENIFVKYYHYPDVVHSYDALMVPFQQTGPGYSSYCNPTLNYVELFDGLPKNADGTLKTKDANGKYILYQNRMDLFANAEPRLRATVIFPGDVFRGQVIDVLRGIYTGQVTNGISSLIPDGYTGTYPTTNLKTSSSNAQTPYTLPNGTTMNPAGLSGYFTGGGVCTRTGFFIRKYMNPNKAQADMALHHSDQPWIEMRYAEVLLNRAEADYELYSDGKTDIDYRQDAFNCINDIRDRAGAILLTDPTQLNINTIRIERKKELAFENKLWWDIKRWRVADTEINNKIYRVLNPFYAANAYAYFFDARFQESNATFTFNPLWYYEPIPAGELITNPNLIQNSGY
ncbi:MAG: RagB/SusD family nutrient uptake outer membrane protein [Bacteroidota bacterium]|nr:RagB/SusD family nutrient uptake outer membrane protein [Bacteroidota bacterium]MDP4289941.1 RagB/SusD family nutrient uptake outer membrane protein [Bacteroidota bacterium]